MFKNISIVAIFFVTVVLVSAHGGDTCNAGYFLSNGKCAECGSATAYCPGDDTRHACPTFYESEMLDWQAMLPGAKVVSYEYYLNTYIRTSINECALVYRLDTESARVNYEVRYNSTTGKYDNIAVWWYSYPMPGYYLTNALCWSTVVYKEVYPCPAGAYCPGSGSISCVNNYAPETLGLTTCGDNTYSNAGASGCTPCPAGTGNTGSNLSDHAGVSSCRALCGAGATKLHAGSYEFNMWSNGQCTTPALRIGLSGGTCCVNLESGSANNAINVSYGGKTYHTVN